MQMVALQEPVKDGIDELWALIKEYIKKRNLNHCKKKGDPLLKKEWGYNIFLSKLSYLDNLVCNLW